MDLRHTHASLLLFAGVSIASVARRLGHASMTTTQKTYLHIIQELENKDVDLVMRTLIWIVKIKVEILTLILWNVLERGRTGV